MRSRETRSTETRELEIRGKMCVPHRQETCSDAGEGYPCNNRSWKIGINHPYLHIR